MICWLRTVSTASIGACRSCEQNVGSLEGPVVAHSGPTPAHDRPLVVPASGALTGATTLPGPGAWARSKYPSAHARAALIVRVLRIKPSCKAIKHPTLWQHELSREPVVGVLVHALS